MLEFFSRYFYMTRSESRGFLLWIALIFFVLISKFAYARWAEPIGERVADLGVASGAAPSEVSSSGASSLGVYSAVAAAAASEIAAAGSSVAAASAEVSAATLGSSGVGALSSDTNKNMQTSVQPANKTRIPYKKREFTLDLNSADTLDFMQLRGIGEKLSKRIVAYRERLGGFVRKDQLLEVYGISEETYSKIESKLQLSKNNVRQIDVNTTSINELKNHPYIDYYLAKEIISTRDRLGGFKDKKQLRSLSLMDAATYESLEVYIKIE